MRQFEARSVEYGRSLRAQKASMKRLMDLKSLRGGGLSPGLQRYFDKIVVETVRGERPLRRDSSWLEALVCRWGLVFRVTNENSYGGPCPIYVVRLRPRAWELASPRVQALCRLGAADNVSEDPYAIR